MFGSFSSRALLNKLRQCTTGSAELRSAGLTLNTGYASQSGMKSAVFHTLILLLFSASYPKADSFGYDYESVQLAIESIQRLTDCPSVGDEYYLENASKSDVEK